MRLFSIIAASSLIMCFQYWSAPEIRAYDIRESQEEYDMRQISEPYTPHVLEQITTRVVESSSSMNDVFSIPASIQHIKSSAYDSIGAISRAIRSVRELGELSMMYLERILGLIIRILQPLKNL